MRRKSVPDLSGRGCAQSDSIGCRQRPPASVGWAAIENPNLSGERPPPARIYLAHNLSHRIYWAQTALAPESVGRAWRCHPLLWGSRVKRHGATGSVGCQPLPRPNLTGTSWGGFELFLAPQYTSDPTCCVHSTPPAPPPRTGTTMLVHTTCHVPVLYLPCPLLYLPCARALPALSPACALV